MWDLFLGYLTGLRLISPELAGDSLLRTVLLVHICDAAMCRLFAHNKGLSKNFWTACGFFLGIWALAVVMVLPRRVRGQE